ncbi:MAG: hypothetical protein Q8P34_10780 [Bacteroidota bacterium]|jgi:hypothetical protein|nr:hypothetical protein [Bacteroidota bacterium]
MRKFSNNTLLYVVAILAIVVAFLLLGGGSFMKGNSSLGLGNLKWIQILISLAIGFGLGLLYSRRRRWW